MTKIFEDLSQVLDGADFKPEAIIARDKKGREAVPLAYMSAIESLLYAYADYKKSRADAELQEKFKAEAKNVLNLRKQFFDDQERFLEVQQNVKTILDMHGLSEAAIDPEAVYGDEVSEDDFHRKLSQAEPIGLYDKKLLSIIGEAGI